MPFHTAFRNEFANWFDADLIALNDHQRMMDDAIAVADKIKDGTHAQTIRRQLSEMLRNWAPDDIRDLANATNVDWNATDEMSTLLREILTKVRDRLGDSRLA